MSKHPWPERKIKSPLLTGLTRNFTKWFRSGPFTSSSGRADPKVLLGLVIGRSTDPVRRTYSLIHQVSHHPLGGVSEVVTVVEPDARVVRNERAKLGQRSKRAVDLHVRVQVDPAVMPQRLKANEPRELCTRRAPAPMRGREGE